MLCEKCGHRQAEWGNLCKECETVGAMEERKADLFEHIRNLSHSAAIAMLIVPIMVVLSVVVNYTVSSLLAWVIVALDVICACLFVYEWQYWHRILIRLKNGEWVQTAYDLLHQPKGLWKYKLHDPDGFVFFQRRRIPLFPYREGINKLYKERMILEQLSKNEQ